MSDIRRYKDLGMEAAMGLAQGMSIVSKFGHAPSGVQLTATDIWGRADATPTQQIWLAPTAARVHAIVSSSAEDGAGTSTGALTIRVYGLTDWDTAEVSEDVTLNGTTPVNTSNSYVMINRMRCLTYGSAGPNVGVITATAATDSTVTAVVLAGDGQTEQAIYGLPSCCSFYMTGGYASMLKATAGTTVGVDINLVCCEDPENSPTVFITKHNDALFGSGTTALRHEFTVPKKFQGPCILKVQGVATAADIAVSAGFDGILVDES